MGWYSLLCVCVQLAAIRVQLNQARDELDECVQKQDFQRAAELKLQVTDLETSRQILIKESQPQHSEVRLEKVMHLFLVSFVVCCMTNICPVIPVMIC
jgi:UvrB/uvrC motif